MKITKREHACLVIEHGDETLVVDPGNFTSPLTGLTGVSTIVVTHKHADHVSSEQLEVLLHANPDARIFGPAGVAEALPQYAVQIVAPGDTVVSGAFTARFFGGTHAQIHESIPLIDNVGVLINESLYYAGDSFTVPPVAVDTLAAPAGAPWMKISEAMDFVLEVAPKRCFPTHEMVLSPAGKSLSNARLQWATEQGGGEFFALEPGDTIEV
jgi:L-ascorbate metabolism protein UlaG (beta-lactamase superfamily)